MSILSTREQISFAFILRAAICISFTLPFLYFRWLFWRRYFIFRRFFVVLYYVAHAF